MSAGRRFPGAAPRIQGRDPRDYERDLQDFLDKLAGSEAEGLPPAHGATHSFDGSDPLTAPTDTPSTVSGASAATIGGGSAPANEDHVHPLDISGTPGEAAAVSAQGVGPGASLSGHTHRLGTLSAKGSLLGFDGTDPAEILAGPDAFFPYYSSGAAEGVDVTPIGSLVVRTIFADYTAAPGDNVILADATGGPITVTLPPAGDAFVQGMVLYVKKVDVGVNTVTVDADGGETIDGALTEVLLTQYKLVGLTTDGTQWFVLTRV